MADPVGSNIGTTEATRFDQALPPKGLILADRVRQLRDDINLLGGDLQTRQTNIPGGNGAGNVGDLNSSPVELIPAQGADKFIRLVEVMVVWAYDSSTAYDVSGNINIEYASGGAGLCPTLNSMHNASAEEANLLYPQSHQISVNTAVQISSTGDMFGSQGDVPMQIICKYRVGTIV